MNIKKTNIEETINKNGQSLIAQQIFKLNDFKVRLTVKSDSYNFQSYARASVWNPSEMQWNHVHSINYDQMSTEPALAYAAFPVKMLAFNYDMKELLKMTKTILF